MSFERKAPHIIDDVVGKIEDDQVDSVDPDKLSIGSATPHRHLEKIVAKRNLRDLVVRGIQNARNHIHDGTGKPGVEQLIRDAILEE